MAQYQPKRLDRALPRPAARRKPQRLRQGAAEPRRLVSAPRRAPVVRLLLMAAALTTAAMMGGTAARYLKDWSDEALVTAGNFYFTCKELEGVLFPQTVSGGWVDYAFTLQNYIVDGYHTESNIAYICKVEDSAGNVVEGVQWRLGPAGGETVATGTLESDNDPATAAPAELSGSSVPKIELICSIPASAFQTEDAQAGGLTIQAASVKPYAKTLTATAKLSEGSGGVELTCTDPGENGGAVSVTLYNVSGEERKGTLRWPAQDLELAPDLSWEALSDPALGWERNGDSAALVLPADRAISVVFLKKDTTQRFQEKDFTFTVSQ